MVKLRKLVLPENRILKETAMNKVLGGQTESCDCSCCTCGSTCVCGLDYDPYTDTYGPVYLPSLVTTGTKKN